MGPVATSTAAGRGTVSALTVEPLELGLPIHRYWQIWEGQSHSFLLDSALSDGRLGRFSFVGGDPAVVFLVRRQPGHTLGRPAIVTIVRRGGGEGSVVGPPTVHTFRADPFEALRRLLARWSAPSVEHQSEQVPFRAGLVGYLGYEMLHFIEQVPPAASRDLDAPDCCLMLADLLLAHDHASGRSFVCAMGQGSSRRLAVDHAARRIRKLVGQVRRFESVGPPEPTAPTRSQRQSVEGFFDRQAYAGLVQRVKDHITAGDAFEVCLTHRLGLDYQGDPWALYCHLRRINPAPFAAFLRTPELTVLSASPERFVKLDSDGWVETRPIKGTRPRGKTPAEDARLRQELANSEKDRAENAMIVDLLRNDLGRVCRFGSISVEKAMDIETYATVFQMVSTIRGRLAQGRDGVDLLRACFPGGSMTGAPKVEAMKIISRLEPVERGVYSGAIGYMDVGGTMDLNIVIRTILLKGGRAQVNVGGAVVADSDPAGEYEETMDKARALLAALAGAGWPRTWGERKA